jgi:hypothetical protein
MKYNVAGRAQDVLGEGLQMKMTAALVLRFFALELVPGHPVQYRTMIVLNMRHGLHVTATPRSSLCSLLPPVP